MAPAVESLLDPAFLARLERLELNVRKLLAGERRGEVSTRRRGAGTLFREHREYVPGDDPRFLDWNAYLRLGDLLVKEFEAEETPRLLILVDRSASMGLGGAAKLRSSLQVAAALGAIGLSRHSGVRCILFPEGEPRIFRGRTSLTRFLEHLSSAAPGGEARFLGAVQAACPRGPAGVAVLVSDFYETGEHALALRFLRHRGFLTHALHVTDRRELAVEAGDRVELVDVETGRRRRERIDAEMARAYAEAVQHHFRAVAETCRSLQVLYATIDVEEPVERVVISLLRRGALVR